MMFLSMAITIELIKHDNYLFYVHKMVTTKSDYDIFLKNKAVFIVHSK